MRTLVCLAFVSLAACSGKSHVEPTDGSTSSVTIEPTAPPTATAAPEPTASSAPPSAPAPTTLEGTFTSPSCDKRTYAREITFSKDGKFGAQDLVSPCPPNARCVWSGIVARAGTFTLTGKTVTLTVTEGADAKPGSPLPVTLTFEGGTLSESSGGATCAYQRR
jgi:hypothetical protein